MELGQDRDEVRKANIAAIHREASCATNRPASVLTLVDRSTWLMFVSAVMRNVRSDTVVRRVFRTGLMPGRR